MLTIGFVHKSELILFKMYQSNIFLMHWIHAKTNLMPCQNENQMSLT